MKVATLFKTGVVSLLVVQFGMAASVEEMGALYEKRCANCHGAQANGVPKIKEPLGVKASVANSNGMTAEKKINIYGLPLNTLTKEEISSKLHGFRITSLDATEDYSVMQDNLKSIEKHEGKIDDEKMAEYIYNTYGQGAN